MLRRIPSNWAGIQNLAIMPVNSQGRVLKLVLYHDLTVARTVQSRTERVEHSQSASVSPPGSEVA